jgi:hypothetical protein
VPWPSRETTYAVLLGASHWPDGAFTDALQFKQSSQAFKAFLTDPAGQDLPLKNVLDLFDDGRPPSELTRSIDLFLKTARAAGPVNDLIVYYVGHGAFDPGPRSDYFLALRSTEQRDLLGTGLAMPSLRRAIAPSGWHPRIYMILDCCFAASATDTFRPQAELAGIVRVKLREEFPEKGIANLCAAGAADPAKYRADEAYTMFSGAMLEVLDRGIEGREGRLSLNTLRDGAFSVLAERYGTMAPRPEVHATDQSSGSVANVDLFVCRGSASGTVNAPAGATALPTARNAESEAVLQSCRLDFIDDLRGDMVSCQLALEFLARSDDPVVICWPDETRAYLEKLRAVAAQIPQHKVAGSLFAGVSAKELTTYAGDVASTLRRAETLMRNAPIRARALVRGMEDYWTLHGHCIPKALANYLTLCNYELLASTIYELRFGGAYERYYPEKLKPWIALNRRQIMGELFSIDDEVWTAKLRRLSGKTFSGGLYFWGPKEEILEDRSRRRPGPILGYWVRDYVIPQNELWEAINGNTEPWRYDEEVEIDRVRDLNNQEI